MQNEMTSEMHHKLKMSRKTKQTRNSFPESLTFSSVISLKRKLVMMHRINCFFVQLLHFYHKYEEGVGHVSITRMGLVGGWKVICHQKHYQCHALMTSTVWDGCWNELIIERIPVFNINSWSSFFFVLAFLFYLPISVSVSVTDSKCHTKVPLFHSF